MSKRAVLALASEAQEALLSAALASQDVAVTTVPPSAHLETEIMRAMRETAEPPLVVIDLAVLAQLASGIASFCTWRNAHCAATRLVFMCCDQHLVRPEERAWACRHGAIDLLNGCSAPHWRETLIPVLRVLLGALGVAPIDETTLAAAIRSLPPYREGGAAARAWSKIAALRELGIRPDEFIAGMRGPHGLEIRDRPYHMKSYEECFVGTEAVDWIAREAGLDRAQAAAAGQTLLELGYLYHVAREQPFLDGFYFYRLAADSARLVSADLHDLLARFRSADGVPIRDRKYRALTFPACFVGSEALAWLTRKQGLSHNEAMTIGQRLIDLFVFHHVTDDHPFKDGEFYYRFYEDERRAVI